MDVYPASRYTVISPKGVNSQNVQSKCKNFRRVSLCLPKVRASVTAEAALAIPLFFFAVLMLFYLLEVMSIRTSMRSGMQYAAKHAAEEMYLKSIVTSGSLESDMVKSIGSERLDRSIVVGGSGGIRCRNSAISTMSGMLDLEVKYQVKLPLPVFAVPPVSMEEKLRMKGWTGYSGTGLMDEEDETVYVTESGMVYHKDYHCHYLELSIHAVPKASVSELRNEDQGKYHACEICARKDAAQVYITDYGDRYHNSITCSGLKRTIYAIPLSEAAGKGACSKCGK